MADWGFASQGWLGNPQPPSQPDGRPPEMETQEVSHTSFVLLRRTQMAISFSKPGFLKGPEFYSRSFNFSNANKKRVVNETKQTDAPKGVSASADVVTFHTGQLARAPPWQNWSYGSPSWVGPDSCLQQSIKCPDVFLSCICINSMPGCQSNT